MQIHFIVGMSRAGTTWLTKCLNEHPSVAAFGETAFWGRKYVSPERDGCYTPQQLTQVMGGLRNLPIQPVSDSPSSQQTTGVLKSVSRENLGELVGAALQGSEEPLTPAQVFQRVAERIVRAERKAIAIEKTPHHLNWIDRIAHALPEAKFVILTRGAYDFMLSYKHQGDRKPPPIRRRFQRLYHPAVCALLWRGYARSALRAHAKYPDRTLLIRFEELVNGPAATLRQIQQFLTLDPAKLHSTVPPANSSFPAGERPILAADDIMWMNMIAHAEIQRLGTSPQKTPFRPDALAWSTLKLPWWTLRNAFALNANSTSMPSYVWRWFTAATTG